MKTTPHPLQVSDAWRRARALAESIQHRAWRIAWAAGIPRDMCCLHNASIDSTLSGWCKDNPQRLKIARRCVEMIDQSWAVTHMGERIWKRAYNRSLGSDAMRYGVKPGRPVNVALLFSR